MDIGFAAWLWSLSLIVITISVHATGVVMVAFGSVRIRARLEGRELSLQYVIPTVIAVIATIGLLLSVLHGIEAAIWAAAYLWLGALDSPADALLYSVDSMATRGHTALTLLRHWEMMGALEAANGNLLFGVSTAYIFTVMLTYWPLLRGRTL
jgi:hypothetical protein